MKACRVCGRLYSDDSGFCQADGQELISVSQVPEPSDDNDPRVGQTLVGRYSVHRVVADGGMGRVYEALDKQENRHVAIKILHPEVAQDEVAVERFKREYEVSKQLLHQHIVEVTDFLPTPDGSYALAMEYLVGEELRATLKRETVVPPERAIRMLSHVALGLDPAHAKGLIHRDLKPDNIFLCQTALGDIAKVLDFGSVKDKRGSAKQLTVMGTTIGSPFYMSPEQAQGLDTLDQRADVWAMAAIFYECITGIVPFQGANGPSILLEILTKEPKPPSEIAENTAHAIPRQLDKALSRGLRKSASVRTTTVGQLADEIGHAYGLGGDHRQWAETDESQLGGIIEENLSRVSQNPSGQPPRGAADDFFGEDDSLGVDGNTATADTDKMDAAFEQASAARAEQETESGQDLVPTHSPVAMYVILGALVCGAVAAALFML